MQQSGNLGSGGTQARLEALTVSAWHLHSGDAHQLVKTAKRGNLAGGWGGTKRPRRSDLQAALRGLEGAVAAQLA